MSYAIVMAVLLELSRLTGWRLHLSQKEFNHISDLSSLVFLILIIYIFSTEYFEGIFTILSILPFLYFLLMLAQDYSTKLFCSDINPGFNSSFLHASCQ
ncbi:MAG: hypothetical protein P8X93_06860 [Gammaproteobacteria bacterium]